MNASMTRSSMLIAVAKRRRRSQAARARFCA